MSATRRYKYVVYETNCRERNQSPVAIRPSLPAAQLAAVPGVDLKWTNWYTCSTPGYTRHIWKATWYGTDYTIIQWASPNSSSSMTPGRRAAGPAAWIASHELHRTRTEDDVLTATPTGDELTPGGTAVVTPSPDLTVPAHSGGKPPTGPGGLATLKQGRAVVRGHSYLASAFGVSLDRVTVSVHLERGQTVEYEALPVPRILLEGGVTACYKEVYGLDPGLGLNHVALVRVFCPSDHAGCRDRKRGQS